MIYIGIQRICSQIILKKNSEIQMASGYGALAYLSYLDVNLDSFRVKYYFAIFWKTI